MASPTNGRPDGGTAPKIAATRARGARRVGLIWMLVISTAAAALVLLGLWAVESGRLARSDTRSGAQAVNAAKAAQFHTPPSS